MKGKICCRRKRLRMLSDLTSSARQPEVERAAEVCEGWRAIDRREECHKPIAQQTTKRRRRRGRGHNPN